jgi:hypothetical protein
MLNRFNAPFHKAPGNQKASAVVSSIWISEANDQHVWGRCSAVESM